MVTWIWFIVGFILGFGISSHIKVTKENGAIKITKRDDYGSVREC